MQKVTDFLEQFGAKATLFEFTIDTSVGDSGEFTPFLNLWAFKADPERFTNAMKSAEENDDINFLYDVVEEVGVSNFEVPLDSFFPDWPENLEEGEAKLKQSLADLVKQSGFQGDVYFHHVDTLPLEKI